MIRETWRGIALLSLALAARPAGAETVRVEPFVLGLERVTKIANARDGSGRLFFATQDGVIRVHDNGALLATPLLDIRDRVLALGEGGFLGLAFHPDLSSHPFFYVYYTDLGGHNVLERYRLSPTDPNVADPASATTVLRMTETTGFIHNGGDIAFGPDGFLYLPTGDGVMAPSAQSLGSLLGKVLRLDVDSAAPYAIPPGNPFASTPGARREIFALGLRNPWRMSFDRATGDLFVADNATGIASEINIIPDGSSGQNFGWPILEGNTCLPVGTTCSTAGLTAPTVALPSPFAAMVGGYRYRGDAIPLLTGAYVFGGYGVGMWGARPGPGGAWTAVPINVTPGLFDSTYGEDESGDLLVANHGNSPRLASGVYRIESSTAPSSVSITSIELHETMEGGPLSWNVDLSAAHFAGPVTVDFTTVDQTAVAGQDYVAAAGTLTFLPGEYRKVVTVQTLQDETYEDIDTFKLRLQNPVGVVLAVYSELEGRILSDDPQPVLTIQDCAAVEGDVGTTPCAFRLALDRPSAFAASASFSTLSGTADGDDYREANGAVTFPPGQVAQDLAFDVFGDTVPEGTETFRVRLTLTGGATGPRTEATGFIVDDDGAASGLELAHGTVLHGDFGTGASRPFRIAQPAVSSYEVVVDGLSGDATAASSLQRLSSDGTTIVQAAGPGRSLRLRWQNPAGTAVAGEVIRLQTACPGACGADDVFRVRAWNTTYSGPRFNNRGGQATVLVLQNLEPATTNATIWFWSEGGALLRRVPQTLPARGTLVLNTSTVGGLATGSGSVTITHDGGYGALAGKLVALDPASGLAFDTPLEPRPR